MASPFVLVERFTAFYLKRLYRLLLPPNRKKSTINGGNSLFFYSRWASERKLSTRSGIFIDQDIVSVKYTLVQDRNGLEAK